MQVDQVYYLILQGRMLAVDPNTPGDDPRQIKAKSCPPSSVPPLQVFAHAGSLHSGSLAISPALPRRRLARRLPNAAARDHRRRNPLHNALPGRRVALSSPTFPVKAALEPEIKRSFSIQSSSFLVSKQHVLPGPRLLTRHPL
ncbi:uncharacterized protein LOC127764474 [Oryza glaberrima]|uniref:uncharacterized protein LOC127764474 n=1 Tax=Oryza glaberrima TaxID=4538 RepID=UPI00224BFC50|nr:uncharacterized protein LOC127764474 [Oryza glaberrima]